ncbi:MAG: alpha/beta hydrolase family protein [Candidatus Helarchaeota archaeon]
MQFSWKKILLLIGIGFLVIGFVFSITFNYILAPCTEKHFQIEADDPNFGVWGLNGTVIDVVMYQPKPEYDIYSNNRPVVVLQHGFSCDKTYMKGAAIELCKRGFVSVSISARGHGASGGMFANGVYFYNECLSVVQWLRNHSSDYKLDINRIGLTGHSMGAVTVTNAAIKDQELKNYWINATVSISGPVYNYSRGDPGRTSADYGALSRIFSTSPLTFMFFYPHNSFDIINAMKESIIEGRVNGTKPYNYLNIDGALDEAFTIESAQEVVWNMGGAAVFTDAPNFRALPSGKLYGDFNGSARKLVIVPNIDHLLEVHDVRVLTEMITWFESSMKISNSAPIVITEPLRMQSILFTILGILFTIIPTIAYIGTGLTPRDTPLLKAVNDIEDKETFKLFGIYGAFYVGLSFAVFPIILTFNLQYFIATDFLLSNILVLFTFVQALFFLPVLVALILHERKKYSEKLEDFGIPRKSLFSSALFGLFLFAIYFIIGNLIASNNYHNMIPYKIGGFLEILCYLFCIFFINELFLRGLIHNKLNRYEGKKIWKIPGKQFILSTLITGVIQGLGVGIVFSMFMFSIGANYSSILMAPMVMIIIYTGLNVIQNILFNHSKNILGSTIFMAFFLAWIFSIIMPAVEVGFSFVFIS